MPAPRQRVVIHAGFHKTGTTSIQATLRANGPVLWPVMALALRGKIQPVVSAARGYSTWRDPISLAKAGTRFGAFVRGLELSPRRQLLISAEELSGHMPGRGDLADYSAAPDLMQCYADELEDIFGDRLDLTFFFSLRQPGAWLKSVYWEHVKSSRMVLDFDDYAARYAGSADLPATIDEVCRAVTPHEVRSAWLEEVGDLPLGPATPLLDLMRLPDARRAALTPGPRRNVGRGDDLLQELLRINRSDLGPEAAKLAKATLLGS
ncbi:hypothetical protein [Actibacterium sp. D379-3]